MPGLAPKDPSGHCALVSGSPIVGLDSARLRATVIADCGNFGDVVSR